MLQTVEGVYRDGRIELLEPPPADVREARLTVTFLTEGSINLAERGADEA